jgi:hypothetical protein
MRSVFRFIIALIFIPTLFQAQLPDTDIWLFKLERDKEQRPVLKEGRNLTQRKGYDNQPNFSKDGKSMYFTSIREDGQADIYTCQLKSGKINALTKTLESEYSPTLYEDGRLLSSVVVEKDSSQFIHLIEGLTGLSVGKLPIDSVGYCTFVNEDTLAYFKLTEPQSLRYYVRSSGEDRLLCTNPIRSLIRMNRHALLFGQKDSLGTTYYQYDFFLRKAVKICRTEAQGEDIIWDQELGLLRSDKSKILRYDRLTGGWETLYDLSLFGIHQLGRFRLDLTRHQLLVVQVLNP